MKQGKEFKVTVFITITQQDYPQGSLTLRDDRSVTIGSVAEAGQLLSDIGEIMTIICAPEVIGEPEAQVRRSWIDKLRGRK